MALLLGGIVRRQARHRPERTAYVIGEERVTYRRLDAMANRLAHALRALGVGRGDRVATLAENRVEYPAIYFAAAKLGAIHVPVNFRYRPGEVRYVLAQSEASVLLHADRFAGAVARERVTYLYLIPTLYHAVLALPEFARTDLSSLRALGSGTQLMTEAQVRTIVERFRNPNLFVMYGQTEAGPVASLRPRDVLRKPTSVGRPALNVDVRVVDADDRDVGAGATGEIVCRSEFTMLGYWRMPDATAQALRGGWLHTGDLGAFDDEGFLHIAGRLKEMIKCGGENIFPVAVERCLLDHPGLAAAAVFGVPDRDWGEIVAAAIVPRPGTALSEDDVVAHVRARLAGYKKPRVLSFLDALPRTASTRQVQKTVLREQWTRS